jgi:hypothetical protein
MKSYWKTIVVPGLFLTLLALMPAICSAQLGDPAGDPDAPIDGGVGVLLAAGVGYGIKKYKDSKKKTPNL